MKKTILLLLILISSVCLSQEKQTKTKLDNTIKVSQSTSDKNIIQQKYRNYLSAVNSHKGNKQKANSTLSRQQNVTYVSKATYTTFLGFVTMRYTVCFDDSPCIVEGGTWWCGCSSWN